MSLVIVGVSLYPLYRDDLARLEGRVRAWFARRDREAEALLQVQREISLMEHGAS